MANALGTLFQDIANAIRSKNGETGTMKPADFPTAISNIESGGDTEHLALLERTIYAIQCRSTEVFGDKPGVFRIPRTEVEDGLTLGDAKAYSYYGFNDLEYLIIEGSVFYNEYSLGGNPNLKIIDVRPTPFAFSTPYVATSFFENALIDDTALEAIIVRSPEGVNVRSVNVLGTLPNSTFYIYVPANSVDSVKSNEQLSTTLKSRIRALEDYPDIDNWYENLA